MWLAIWGTALNAGAEGHQGTGVATLFPEQMQLDLVDVLFCHHFAGRVPDYNETGLVNYQANDRTPGSFKGVCLVNSRHPDPRRAREWARQPPPCSISRECSEMLRNPATSSKPAPPPGTSSENRPPEPPRGGSFEGVSFELTSS